MSGYGSGGAVLLGVESPAGTPASSFNTIPFVSEDLKFERPTVPGQTITGRRSQTNRNSGRRRGTGGITQELDLASFGFLFNLLNGTASGALTSAALPGRIATHSAAAASGGDIPAGTYLTKVACVLQRTIDSSLWVMPASSAQSVTLSASNLQIDYSWSNPSSFPRGFTQAGVKMYRSAAGGSSGSEKGSFYQTGTGTSYSLSDADLFYSNEVPLVATGYLHEYVEAYTAGVNPLPPFTGVVKKDVTGAHRGINGRMDSLDLSFGDGDQPWSAKWGMMFRDFDKVTNPAHSLSDIQKCMGWQTVVGLNDGSVNETVENATLSIKNGCELIPGSSGQARFRDVGFGVRDVGFQFGRGFEDNTFFDYMREFEKFKATMFTWGGPLAAAAAGTTTSFPTVAGEVANVFPMAYMLQIEAFGLALSESGANIGGFGRLIESNNGGAERDPSAGTDLRVTLINLTSGY